MKNVSAAVVALALAAAAPAFGDPVRGSDVRRAQQVLSDLGYPVGAPDGRIGPQTRTAIRNFQRDKNLNATGELTEETMDALKTASSEPDREIVDTRATSGAPSASAIRRAQQQLDRLGYPVGRADGEMGNETRTAIRNFQRDKNLNATGDLDAETRAALDTGSSATSGAHPHEPR